MASGSTRPWIVLTLITAIMFSSGCVMPWFPIAPASGNGVVITEWEPDFSQVYSGEEVTFYSNVKNAGSFEARNVRFQLIDLDGWSDLKSNSIDCESGNINLLAPDAQYGTAGQEKMCSWTATSPSIERGLHMAYSPKVLVCYDYLSTATLRTPSISRYELKRLQDSGDGLPSQSTISSGSPISVSASTPSPIIVTDNQVTFPVRISVINGGGGMFCVSDDRLQSCTDSEKINKVSLEIKSSTATVAECPTELVFFENRGEVTCDMVITSGAQTLIENDVDITAGYRYCVDSTTRVEVQGR
jgi:hypothetical protein